MSFRFNDVELTQVLTSMVSAASGILGTIWTQGYIARKKAQGETNKAAVDMRRLVDEAFDRLLKQHNEDRERQDKRIQELERTVDDLQRQIESLNHDKYLAEIAAETNRQQADNLRIEKEGLATLLKECGEERAALLHQLGKQVAPGVNGHVKEAAPNREA